MISSRVDLALRHVGCGKSTYMDELTLRHCIMDLERQLADAQDALRRELMREHETVGLPCEDMEVETA